MHTEAHRAHPSATPALRLRRNAPAIQNTSRSASELRETPLMMRMMRALAA